MKKASLIFLIILLFTVFLLTGCTTRENGSAETGEISDVPSASPEAVVTPEPIPTPVPVDLVISHGKNMLIYQ